jgi:hypothetical protein
MSRSQRQTSSDDDCSSGGVVVGAVAIRGHLSGNFCYRRGKFCVGEELTSHRAISCLVPLGIPVLVKPDSCAAAVFRSPSLTMLYRSAIFYPSQIVSAMRMTLGQSHSGEWVSDRCELGARLV